MVVLFKPVLQGIWPEELCRTQTPLTRMWVAGAIFTTVGINVSRYGLDSKTFRGRIGGRSSPGHRSTLMALYYVGNYVFLAAWRPRELPTPTRTGVAALRHGPMATCFCNFSRPLTDASDRAAACRGRGGDDRRAREARSPKPYTYSVRSCCATHCWMKRSDSEIN